jgi:hypothetical protein
MLVDTQVILVIPKDYKSLNIKNIMSLLLGVFTRLFLVQPDTLLFSNGELNLPNIYFINNNELNEHSSKGTAIVIYLNTQDTDKYADFSSHYNFSKTSHILNFLHDFEFLSVNSLSENIFIVYQQSKREKASQNSLMVLIEQRNFDAFITFYKQVWVHFSDIDSRWFLRCFTIDKNIYQKLDSLPYLDAWEIETLDEFNNHLDNGQYFLLTDEDNPPPLPLIDKISKSGAGILYINSAVDKDPTLHFHQLYKCLIQMETSFETKMKISYPIMNFSSGNSLSRTFCPEFKVLSNYGFYQEETDGVWLSSKRTWLYVQFQDAESKKFKLNIFNNEDNQRINVSVGLGPKQHFVIPDVGLNSLSIAMLEFKFGSVCTLEINVEKQGANLFQPDNVDDRGLGVKLLFQV